MRNRSLEGGKFGGHGALTTDIAEDISEVQEMLKYNIANHGLA